jgi:hypothetical protein
MVGRDRKDRRLFPDSQLRDRARLRHHRSGCLGTAKVEEGRAASSRKRRMKARGTIEYEPDWPEGLSLQQLREREEQAWMTTRRVLDLRRRRSRLS